MVPDVEIRHMRGHCFASSFSLDGYRLSCIGKETDSIS